MKQTIILIMVAVALFGVGLLTFADDTGQIQREKIIIQKFNHQSTNSIGQYKFPLTVNSFVKELGKPDSTFKDENESCPVGQLHTWCLRSQNLKILVLGDVYKPTVDYSAPTRFFAVAKCDSGKDSGFSGIWGIKLGDSEKEINQKLSQLQKQNKKIIIRRNIKGAPLHVVFNVFHISHHHSVQKDNLYFYFVINKQGRLEIIVQSSFNLSTVC
jgi:hypothetical protein